MCITENPPKYFSDAMFTYLLYVQKFSRVCVFINILSYTTDKKHTHAHRYIRSLKKEKKLDVFEI